MSENVSGIINIGITIGGSLASLNPLLGAISEIIKHVLDINEKAQYNKKISRTILGRLLSVEAALKFLLIQKEDFGEKFSDLKYQESLHTLKNVLDKIKDFTEQVTQLRGLEKWINAQNIEKNYKELMEEYDSCLNSLKFTMIIAFDEQKRIDNECLKNDIAETKKFLEDFANYHKEQTNLVYQEIKHVQNRIESNSEDSIDVREIESHLIKDPPHDGAVANKVYILWSLYFQPEFFSTSTNFSISSESIHNFINYYVDNYSLKAWKQQPEERIGISALYLRLSELSSVVKKSPSL
ncbi:22114_t:CDS:2, partial [Dentiscutata erythropus]